MYVGKPKQGDNDIFSRVLIPNWILRLVVEAVSDHP